MAVGHEAVHPRVAPICGPAGRILGVAIRWAARACCRSPITQRYLTAQIIATYLRITGRESKAGPFRSLVPAVGASIVDPWVSQVINPENLVELLRGGTIQSELGEVSFKTGELPNFSLNTAWNAWLNSEYGLGHFSIGWPADAAATEQFRLRMQLLEWRWKLTGIDLPEKLRDQFARELAKKYP